MSDLATLDVTAVVVARSGSVRLPGKALLPFAGRTLVGHKVAQLAACPGIARVVIGSDSPEILAEGQKYGAIPLVRDAYHTDEKRCPANDMLADVASRVEGKTILWAHPTNPLVRTETYAAALKLYARFAAGGTYDSLLSVTPVQRHAWVMGRPLNYDPWTRPHTLAKDLPPIRFQDGAIFLQPREAMVRNRYFFGDRPLLFDVPAHEGWDIDTYDDYRVALGLWSVYGDHR